MIPTIVSASLPSACRLSIGTLRVSCMCLIIEDSPLTYLFSLTRISTSSSLTTMLASGIGGGLALGAGAFNDGFRMKGAIVSSTSLPLPENNAFSSSSSSGKTGSSSAGSSSSSSSASSSPASSRCFRKSSRSACRAFSNSRRQPASSSPRISRVMKRRGIELTHGFGTGSSGGGEGVLSSLRSSAACTGFSTSSAGCSATTSASASSPAGSAASASSAAAPPSASSAGSGSGLGGGGSAVNGGSCTSSRKNSCMRIS